MEYKPRRNCAGIQLEAVRQAAASPSRIDAAADDLEQLRRENAKLKMEIEILKKAAIYFARESK
jgi:transposase-like protein